jgi:flagellar basal-body rod modification protein FlgD
MSDFMMINNTQSDNYMRELQKQGAQRKAKDTLGKDDFFKILVAQLTHQDPTQPMEEREFIAQMAQFSSLEQMQNLNKEFSRIANLVASSQVVNLIGKTVDVMITGRDEAGKETRNVISGRVLEVTGGSSPQVLVNGNYFDYSAVVRIREDQ